MCLLINQLDEHNEANILASLNKEINEVIFLYLKEQEELMSNLEKFYENNLPNININKILINEGDINQINEIIAQFNIENLVINLTGGKRINSLILLSICKEKGIKSIYLDIKNKEFYKFNEYVDKESVEYRDLDISSIIKAAGGKIVEDSSNLCDKKDLIYLSKAIYTHLDLWNMHKLKLYDVNIIKHDENEPSKIYINKEKLNKEEIELLYIILNKLKEMKEIKYIESNKNLTVIFLNEYIKGFIFKSGTWLEIATNNLMKKIKEIDESKNGVIFLWNNEKQSIRNELDVVAVKDSVPICISCKDSDKYNEMALNELNVYANKLGGKNTYKILVSTKEAIKSTVKTRASEMGINIVIFDGDENKFIETMKRIIIAES